MTSSITLRYYLIQFYANYDTNQFTNRKYDGLSFYLAFQFNIVYILIMSRTERNVTYGSNVVLGLKLGN